MMNTKTRTKNILSLTSILAVGSFFYLEHLNVLKDCHYGIIEGCNVGFYIISSILLIFFPILVWSLISYFLSESTVDSWQKFTYWYLALFILVVLTFPESEGGGGWVSGGGITKATYGLLLSAIYSLTSLILVIKWSFRAKDSK
jgi:hypothetical protein